MRLDEYLEMGGHADSIRKLKDVLKELKTRRPEIA
jgi:hypothetical protein